MKGEHKITHHELEAAYRRGYQQGYLRAAEDTQRITTAGYTRIREICNFLVRHADTLYHRWRVPHLQRREALHLPPELEVHDWPELRTQILRRDGHTCQWCGTSDELEVDHITEVRNGGVAHPDNLRTLCRPCNASRNKKGAE